MSGGWLHPRTMRVEEAKGEFGMLVARFQAERGLTNTEMLIALAEQQQGILRCELRAERHPDDPGRKADEE